MLVSQSREEDRLAGKGLLDIVPSDQTWAGKNKPYQALTLHGSHWPVSSDTWNVLELLHTLVYSLEGLDDVLLQLLGIDG